MEALTRRRVFGGEEAGGKSRAMGTANSHQNAQTRAALARGSRETPGTRPLWIAAAPKSQPPGAKRRATASGAFELPYFNLPPIIEISESQAARYFRRLRLRPFALPPS
jgi:hypothetical protein